MNYPLIFGFIAIAVVGIGSFTFWFDTVYAEEEYLPFVHNDFYYLSETDIYGIVNVTKPLVCTYEIEDLSMPEDTNETLMNLADKSIKNWEKALGDYTNNHEVWKMEHKIIPLNQQYQSNFEKFEAECQIIINFIPEHIEWLWEEMGLNPFDALGVTDNIDGQISDIYIVYREVAYDVLEYEALNEYEELEQYVDYDPIYHLRELPYDLEETITHELGHAFSLDHKPVFWENFYEKDGIMFSDSIMGDPTDIPETYEDIIGYEITKYDIKAMVNIYGENGFIPDSPLGFDEYLFKEPTLMQKTLKQNIKNFPDHFPTNYIEYLDSIGLII